MKRFTYIFILLFTFILTLGIVNSFNESYFNRLQFLPVEFKYQTEKDSLVLNLYLKENNLSENDAMKRLLHLAKENKLEVMVTLEHKDILGRSVKSTYIYSDKFKLNNVAYLEKEIDINFSDEKQKGYISSDPLDDKKIGGIRFLTSKYTRGKEYPVLRFLPMHSFEENNEASVNFFVPTNAGGVAAVRSSSNSSWVTKSVAGTLNPGDYPMPAMISINKTTGHQHGFRESIIAR